MKRTGIFVLLLVFLVGAGSANAGLEDKAVNFAARNFYLSPAEVVKIINTGDKLAKPEVLPAGTTLIFPQWKTGELQGLELASPNKVRVYRGKNNIVVVYHEKIPFGFIMPAWARKTPAAQQTAYQPPPNPIVQPPSMDGGNSSELSRDLPVASNDETVGNQPQVLVAKEDDAELMTRPSEMAVAEVKQKAERTQKAYEAYKKQRTKNIVNAGFGISAIGAAFYNPLYAAVIAAGGIIYNLFTYESPPLMTEAE